MKSEMAGLPIFSAWKGSLVVNSDLAISHRCSAGQPFSILRGFRRKNYILAKASNPRARQTLSFSWHLGSSSMSRSISKLEELDVNSMLLRQRIVFLGGQVDDMIADLVISQLLLLDSNNQKEDITLFINSPGGSITAGMGIYDAMKLCKADVSTVCLGLAASMGAFILASGTKGKRFCMPNGRVMIHQPLGTAGGAATEMGIRVREMLYHKIKLNNTLSRVTGKPLQQIEIDTERDNFMHAWDAKAYGLVDQVVDDGKFGLVAPVGDSVPPPKARLPSFWKSDKA